MEYSNELNSNISINMNKLRDSTVDSNRILILSRYVRQHKNKNSAFSFTRNPYEYIVNPDDYTTTTDLIQFVQNSSFLISHLQDHPDLLALIIHSTTKQWQFLYLVDCIIPSIFGYFSCHEYSRLALTFYSGIINEFPPDFCIQIIQPFLHSGITYQFFENSYGRFVYTILIDKNILKSPDTLVTVFADLLIENIKKSIKFLPEEFFELLDIIRKKRWNFDNIKSLILDNFLIPELKIWSTQLDINIELKNFVYRIIDLITISMSSQNVQMNLSPRSSSMNFQSSLYLTDFSGSTNFSSLCFNLDYQAQPKVASSRSYSLLVSSQPQNISEQSRRVILMMNTLIESFFVKPSESHSVYETAFLYENYPDDTFSQFTQFTISVFDVQFLARVLVSLGKFPTKISKAIFLNDSVRPYVGGVFYCHVFSTNTRVHEFRPFLSLFKNRAYVQSIPKDKSDNNGLNIAFLENESFVNFLCTNSHYGRLFELFMIKTEEKAQFKQVNNMEKLINYFSSMKEIEKQNDKFNFHSSFLLDSFLDQILDDVKNHPNILKSIPFIELYERLTERFNYSNLIQMKKNLYTKLIGIFYVDLIGGYWNVLLDFKNFWLEYVKIHEKKKSIIRDIRTSFCFYTNSIELLSKIDKQPLHVKYLIMIWAFTNINHIANHVHDRNEVYEMFFKKIKSKEFILSFLVIDCLEMRVEVFRELCSKEELDCWNCMKKNIELYLKQNKQFYQVYQSICEYLLAISPSVLYNTIE